MGLEQQLIAFKSEFARSASAGRPALYEAKIEELRASFALEETIGVDDQGLAFTPPDAPTESVGIIVVGPWPPSGPRHADYSC